MHRVQPAQHLRQAALAARRRTDQRHRRLHLQRRVVGRQSGQRLPVHVRLGPALAPGFHAGCRQQQQPVAREGCHCVGQQLPGQSRLGAAAAVSDGAEVALRRARRHRPHGGPACEGQVVPAGRLGDEGGFEVDVRAVRAGGERLLHQCLGLGAAAERAQGRAGRHVAKGAGRRRRAQQRGLLQHAGMVAALDGHLHPGGARPGLARGCCRQGGQGVLRRLGLAQRQQGGDQVQGSGCIVGKGRHDTPRGGQAAGVVAGAVRQPGQLDQRPGTVRIAVGQAGGDLARGRVHPVLAQGEEEVARGLFGFVMARLHGLPEAGCLVGLRGQQAGCCQGEVDGIGWAGRGDGLLGGHRHGRRTPGSVSDGAVIARRRARCHLQTGRSSFSRKRSKKLLRALSRTAETTCSDPAHPTRTKFFGSFFQKRTACLLSYPTTGANRC